MDFNDTREEAEFRAEARAWLEQNAKLRKTDEAAPRLMAEREDTAVLTFDRQLRKKFPGRTMAPHEFLEQ